MKKKIVLIGHCGPDATYLRLAVARAITNAEIMAADDEQELSAVLRAGADLLLLNRQLDWGFKTSEGIALIEQIRKSHPQLKLMLVSNHPEAQAAAVEAGALPGFGKRELGSPRVAEAIRSALGEAQ